MEILWAPWRMTYIAGAGGADTPPPAAPPAPDPAPGAEPAEPPPPTGCIFCDKVAEGPGADRRNLILWRGTHTFVILNLYPYNSGHLRVVPYRHLADVTLLTTAETAELMATFQRMIRLLGQVYHPDGYNVGMNLGHVAGAGIADHVHLHILERWCGDINTLPVVGQTKVLPESLEQTWERLTKGIRDQGSGVRSDP
jgi:ATP adenylyltransferase